MGLPKIRGSQNKDCHALGFMFASPKCWKFSSAHLEDAGNGAWSAELAGVTCLVRAASCSASPVS